MRAILAGIIFTFACSFSFASTNELPLIRDVATLQKDCALLYQRFPNTEGETNTDHFGNLERNIPSGSWPSTLQALGPFKVSRDDYGILIWILRDSSYPGKDDFGSTGYYIHENPDRSPPRFAHSVIGGVFELKYTKYKGIDAFYLPHGLY